MAVGGQGAVGLRVLQIKGHELAVNVSGAGGWCRRHETGDTAVYSPSTALDCAHIPQSNIMSAHLTASSHRGALQGDGMGPERGQHQQDG